MIGAEFHNSPGHLQLLFYELDKFDGMRLKTDSLHCRSFSQNMSREIPKVRRTSYNLLPVKTFVRHISQTSRRIEKHFFV